MTKRLDAKSYKVRTIVLLLPLALCACSRTRQESSVPAPLPAHFIDTDGTPVSGAPEPEVVQLKSVETSQGELHVTVGNVAGDYVLICDSKANKEEGMQTCLAPQPQRDYLLFRKNTKWLMKGATKPMDLDFMQDFSIRYNDKENIGLVPAKSSGEETFQMFWLSSWVARSHIR